MATTNVGTRQRGAEGRRLILVVFAVAVIGCGREEQGVHRFVPPSPVAPSPAPPPPPPVPAPTPRPIVVGQEVKDTFVGQPMAFELTPATDGTLVARVDWDVWFNGTLLVLVIDGTQFKPVSPAWAPVVGKVAVKAGQTYRLMITPGGSDWIYNDPFVLTTSIE